MNILKPVAIAAALAASLLLTACDKTPDPAAAAAAAKAAPAPVTIDAIKAETTGFTVGSPMSVRTVYVFFDAQCPHCAALWNSAKPLKSQTKFVWIPVGVINKASTTQGATILSSKDPSATMEENETSILSKQGGISAGSGIDDMVAKVGKNTELFNKFGFESIPTVVALHAQTGLLVKKEGSMPTPELANFLGLAQPAQ
ncbi:thioredoxin fold domain-containing protein [Caenimonas koreensis]|uniref:thioredoxin fold domain-containing protein n=1 Tax=Caenimonas koreensis TaxID=367474 RepID=UPI0037851828